MLNDQELEAIRQKMSGMEATPPPAAWGKISQEISHTPWWKKRPLWWSTLALLGLISVVMTADFDLREQEPPKEVQHTAEIRSSQDQERPEADTLPEEQPTNVQSAKLSGETSKAEIPVKAEAVPQAAASLDGRNATQNLVQPTQVVAREIKSEAVIQQEVRKIAALPLQADLSLSLPVLAEQVPAGSQEEEGDKSLGPDAVELLESANGTLAGTDNTSDKALTEIIPEAKKPMTYISLHFTPQYIYRFIEPLPDDEVYVIEVAPASRSAFERRGYSLGVQYGRGLGKNMQVEAGLSMLSLRQDLNYRYNAGEIDTLLYTKGTDGQVTLLPQLSIRERELKSRYTYGSLHAGVHYFFGENQYRRFNLYLGGGMNVLVRGVTEEYEENELMATLRFPSGENPLEQSNYHLQVGAGYNRRIDSRYELNVMPVVSYFLGSTYREREPLSIRSYTVGLKFQLRRYAIQ